MKIVLAEARDFNRDALALLHRLGEVIEIDGSREELQSQLPGADVLIVRLAQRIDAALFDLAPSLRVVVSPTTGLDHIDLAAAKQRGVAVLSLKGETAFLENVTATAELTWALILHLARPVAAAQASVVEGAWSRDSWKGRELKKKVLGVVGYGRLGRIVAEYARAFRMTVLAHDRNADAIDGSVEAASLQDLLTRSDIVSLHVPLESDTKDLIAARELGWMKPGAWLINTSRGEIIDEAALLQALQSGHLGGAALDVLAQEAKGRDDWLSQSALVRYAAQSDRLIITPHIGGATLESMHDTEDFMVRKLIAYLDEPGLTETHLSGPDQDLREA